MSKGSAMLLGALIGGGVGFVLGAILADHFAPEYYTEEELEQLAQILKVESYERNDDEIIVNVVGREGDVKKVKHDYGSHYKKPELSELVQRYDEAVDTEASQMDDEGNYLDEDDIYEDVPMIDYTDLDGIDENMYIDLRDTEVPYIITEQEWYDEESGFKRGLLKYYSDDEVLTLENDKPVDNIERVIGDYALDNFGAFGSDDDVVYVCNPNLEREYKVVRLDRSYEESVVNGPRHLDRIDTSNRDEWEEHNIFDDDTGELP